MSNYSKTMTEIYRDSLKNKTLTVVTIEVSGGDNFYNFKHLYNFVRHRANPTA